MKKIAFASFFLIALSLALKSQVRIQMQNEGGVYTTPCIVNGLKLKFIFDTGASNVSISLSEAVFMLKNGYLEESDIRGSSYSQIANGDIIENTTINLREIEIGGIKIYDVEASIIHEASAPLLLGQSAIKKLGRIQIEGDEIIILEHNNKMDWNACLDAIEMKEEAEKNYFEDLYAISANLYKKSYDLCGGIFECFDFALMGNSYYYLQKYPKAIKYLKKTSNCAKSDMIMFYVYHNMGDSYSELGDFDNAILNTQLALTHTNENYKISTCYFQLGYIYGHQNKHYKAIKNFEKRIDYYMKHLSINEQDILKGTITDETLGETYYNVAINYKNVDEINNSKKYLIKSALCGYKPAINICNEYDIKY